jgi:hypothetical protein
MAQNQNQNPTEQNRINPVQKTGAVQNQSKSFSNSSDAPAEGSRDLELEQEDAGMDESFESEDQLNASNKDAADFSEDEDVSDSRESTQSQEAPIKGKDKRPSSLN